MMGDGNKGENREGGIELEDEKQEGDADCLRRERERVQTRENGLFVILQRSGISTQTLSAFAKHRESFGLAWLLVWVYKKTRALGKISVDPVRGIDLSGTFGLSPKKIFLFLNALPSSAEEMKLDSVAVKGGGLPLFVSFLERLQSARDGGQDAPRLKRFVFAEDSCKSEEAPEIFPSLLGSVESLSLKGNALSTAVVDAIAQAIRNRNFKASFLRCLDLEKTGLTAQTLARLCEGIKGKPLLHLEELNLSQNIAGIWPICSVLRVGALPNLRVLLLRHCGIISPHILQLAPVLEGGHLPNLETLDLEGNHLYDVSLGLLTQAVCVKALPRLKNLNLMSQVSMSQRLSDFLEALSPSATRPPLEKVAAHLKVNSEVILGAIAGGHYDVLRVLRLHISSPRGLSLFLRELSVSFEVLDLDWGLRSIRHTPSEVGCAEVREALSLLGEALGGGRLNFLRKLKVGVSMTGLDEEERGVVTEGRKALFDCFSRARLPALSELSVREGGLVDDDLIRVASAVRVGNLPTLRVLELCSEGGARLPGGGVQALMEAVLESKEGLPVLEDLVLGKARVGEAGGSVVSALVSGKLPSLARLGDEVFLDSLQLDEEGVAILGEAVRTDKFPNLSGRFQFSLSMRNISVDSLITGIAESKKGLPPCVTCLNLSGGRLSEEALASLARGVGGGKLSGLASLNLSECGIDDALLLQLGEVFSVEECRGLRYIDLSRNRISVDGFSAFIDALRPESLPSVYEILLEGQEGFDDDESRQNFSAQIGGLMDLAESEGKLLQMDSW
uniref:Uncharacterized protein n=1 Tax=Chromera velia CCMP2878 TaxID=1169474 RepID=A0A0G4H9S5_9ALVE|eukprot:Cvel_6014.t1-p1 / transcript=Cvel_6014.t1 / gene=Cvel_6014 / organism=Chromera_velia_CCMP2878 / gene_product=NACHT, LRR and PYD domains-containing protein 1, putative / transcript_product=NACHT, LRR and PYD domains-containing protein 1, putative / location=Cvel_scaffold288:19297-23639(-) / protein_length=788 / sequence_SO=supercontig / SO=protein_coding / is_pseudo=false